MESCIITSSHPSERKQSSSSTTICSTLTKKREAKRKVPHLKVDEATNYLTNSNFNLTKTAKRFSIGVEKMVSGLPPTSRCMATEEEEQFIIDTVKTGILKAFELCEAFFQQFGKRNFICTILSQVKGSKIFYLKHRIIQELDADQKKYTI